MLYFLEGLSCLIVETRDTLKIICPALVSLRWVISQLVVISTGGDWAHDMMKHDLGNMTQPTQPSLSHYQHSLPPLISGPATTVRLELLTGMLSRSCYNTIKLPRLHLSHLSTHLSPISHHYHGLPSSTSPSRNSGRRDSHE